MRPEGAGPWMCGRIGATAYGLSPPTAWDLTPEQTSNNGKLMRHLIKSALPTPVQTSSF